MKKWLLIIIILFVIAVVVEVNCQTSESEAGPVIQTAKGAVSAINWVADMLVVRVLDHGVPDEETFLISRKTVITRDTSTISFGDVLISNSVTVSYINTLAGLKAIRITVKR